MEQRALHTTVQRPLGAIRPTERHNYVAFFLTLRCNLHCPWCINLHDGGSRADMSKRTMDADDWIRAANRLALRPDLPLTLQGGEPTLHPGFYRLVNEIKPEIKCDLLTNMRFDVEEFIANVPPERFTREAPYAPIRVSYHPGQNDIEELLAKYFRLVEAGFRVGLYGILHPDPGKRGHIESTMARCLGLGVDFRTKEYLGEWDGALHGHYLYPGAVMGGRRRSCRCRTGELLVDPAGGVYKCHSDLLAGRASYAHILDPDFTEANIDEFRDCACFGECNPCDVKVKTNRFQQFGHTSVEIVDLED
ncbi:radical SAM protein [Fundidesulfovibrio butyratiphilus]